MNWRAASFTRAVRVKLVLRSSSTRTKTRPLNSLLLLRTSGSTGLVLKSGGSNFSTGMSTSDAIETDCGLPRSRTSKSSLVRSRTKLPCWSVTIASIST